jgi:vesicle-fusing ATPase
MEIGLPDEGGRVQILMIHTLRMRDSGYMGADVSLAELSKETKNYSGAEIEGVVRSATSFALNRNIDTSTLKNLDPKNIKITREDFMNALNEVKPAFGAAEDELSAAMTNGIINFGDEFSDVYQSANLLIEQVRNSSRTPIVSFLLAGKPGAGKTALAAKLALHSGFAFVKLLSPDNFVGYQEQARVLKIAQAFEDAYKSQTSLIIVDDIERFLDYTPIGHRFSNAVLQALLVLFRRVPPKGRKLLVMGTTSNVEILGDMGFLQATGAVLQVPSLTDGAQVKRVLTEIGGFSAAELDEVARGWNGKIEMKRLIMLAEMAKQLHIDSGGSTSGVSLGRRFLDMIALRG